MPKTLTQLRLNSRSYKENYLADEAQQSLIEDLS